MNLDGFKSLDTETTGLDPHHGSRPFFVTMCTPEFENTHWEFHVNPLTREVKYAKSEVEEIIHEIETAEGIVLQNSGYDISMIMMMAKDVGIEFEWPWYKTHDTLVMAHILRSDKRKDLTSLALEHLGVDIDKYEQRIRKITGQARNYVRLKASKAAGYRIAKVGLPEMPSVTEKVWKADMWLPKLLAERGLGPFTDHWFTALEEYATGDSTVTISLARVLLEKIKKKGLWAIYQQRLKILPVIHKMQQRGVTLSIDKMEELVEEYSEESTKTGAMLLETAKTHHNVDLVLPKNGVNNVLRDLIFNKFKLPVVFRSAKTKAPSMDAKTIAVWVEDLDPESVEHRFVSGLAAKRKRDTALSYCESYKRFWKPFCSNCGKIVPGWMVLYPSLNLTGTATLRCSCSNPNEQNISKKDGFNLRSMFGPAPGREWWSMDAQNIELRIPAYESGERELIDLFETPDVPPYYGSTHLLNFHTVYEDLWEEELKAVGLEQVGPHCKKKYAATWYQYCKNGGFAVQYGAIDRPDGDGTADQAFHRRGAHALLKKRFSRLEKLNQKCIHHANRYGYVETIPDKSVDPERGYPLYCEKNYRGEVKPTVPLNYHVQGTAMWWMGSAMVKCEQQLKQWKESSGFDGYIVMQVHDELVFDLPKGANGYKTNLPKARKLARLMSSCGDDIGIPTPVSIKYHDDNWAEEISV